MKLTYNKLIKFNLMEEYVKKLFSENKLDNYFELSNTIREIQSIDQFIKDSPSYPGSTDKIIRSELVSAIGATLAIEGITLQKEEIEESFRKASLNEKLERKEQEAENSRKVYSFIIELVNNNNDLKYTERIIKQIHKYFTDGLNYLSNKPGDYRDFSISFGVPRIGGLCRTRLEIENAMKNFIIWLNDGENVTSMSSEPIVKAILSHYYLTEIHPFGDGNGRTSRALEALFLYVNGVNNYCFWSLANFWSMHRDEYLIQIRNIRNTCCPWEFVLWGIKGYLEEIKRIKLLVLKKVKQLMLMDYVKYLLANKRKESIKINQRIVDILSYLVKSDPMPINKFYSLPLINTLYRNSSPSLIYKDLKKMINKQLVIIGEDENEKKNIRANFDILKFISYYV